RRQVLVRPGGGAEVERQDFTRLQPAIAPDGQAFRPRPLRQAAAAMIAQHREMDQYVAGTVIGDHEAKAPRGVEPFDDALVMLERLFGLRSDNIIAVDRSP